QNTNDDIDWTRNSGGTPSSNTGPTSASEGSFYVYVESSSPNYPSKRTILTSPCFALPSAAATLTFQYHMWGAAMGSLNLELSTDNGSTWASVWSRSGDQGNAWASASVSLASYAGSTITLRFNGLTGSNYTGDMSVDDIGIAAGSTGSGCSGGISSFPYSEGFESGMGLWTQGSGDDFDWTRNSGGTPSSNTGPSSAASGSFYMYTESSTPNYSNKVAILNSPCFDLSSLSSATFTFQYHLYGAAAMGGMVLEASSNNGAAWNAVWSANGNQGNSWQSGSANLDSYAGSTLLLRFVGTTGTTWQGDMAIDDVALSSGGSTGGCNTVNISITFDNYPEETSWEIKSGNTVVASGGTYGSQADGSTLLLTECLADGCYDFVIADVYGDGICCSYGNGSYLVTNSSNVTLASGASFTNSETTNFCVSGGARVEAAPVAKGLNIFPNPVVQTLNFTYQSDVDAPALLRIADMTGRIVHTQSLVLNQGMNEGGIQVENLAAGSYMLSISSEKAMLTKRFIIAK
ncbi:MAG TPA: T9SS type A sorting domain-containing protein, partial [Bacteroidetes bacterium]|nr:T9SS type A sorting domain-containing protein [Bacteroidota bacterium]